MVIDDVKDRVRALPDIEKVYLLHYLIGYCVDDDFWRVVEERFEAEDRGGRFLGGNNYE